MTISCSSSVSPSISAWTRTLVRSSVGFSRRSSIIWRQRSKISGMSFCEDLVEAARVEVVVARDRAPSSSAGPDRVVLRRMPMKLPITRETTGWAMSVTRSQPLAARDARRAPIGDRADRVLVLGDPLRREPALEERLEPVVLGRVLGDEHRRVSSSGIAWVSPMTPPRSEEKVSPVEADLADVGGLGDRPEAVLVRVLVDLRPVDGTLAAQLLEELVRAGRSPSAGDRRRRSRRGRSDRR